MLLRATKPESYLSDGLCSGEQERVLTVVRHIWGTSQLHHTTGPASIYAQSNTRLLQNVQCSSSIGCIYKGQNHIQIKNHGLAASGIWNKSAVFPSDPAKLVDSDSIIFLYFCESWQLTTACCQRAKVCMPCWRNTEKCLNIDGISFRSLFHQVIFLLHSKHRELLDTSDFYFFLSFRPYFLTNEKPSEPHYCSFFYRTKIESYTEINVKELALASA